jgi:hypothetical protein
MITIPKEFLEHLLNCLAIQRYIEELDTSDRILKQVMIDDTWNDGWAILNQVSFVPFSDVLMNILIQSECDHYEG